MRDWLRWGLIGLAVLAVGVMAIGYSFIFRGVASRPVGTIGTLEVPPAGRVVAETLEDGTPVFVVNLSDGPAVLDARSPADPGWVPVLVAWCDDIGAFETGFLGEGDLVRTLGFEPDGTSFGLVESAGLARYAVRQEDSGRVVVTDSTSHPGGRISGSPDCPAGAERVMHQPADEEIFDPSVAIEEEPPGVIWLEGTLRTIEEEVVLCDKTPAGSNPCADGAPAAGIDPATIGPDGIDGLFVGLVRDGAISGLAHALVLTEAEGS
jgi:hypothetical protein